MIELTLTITDSLPDVRRNAIPATASAPAIGDGVGSAASHHRPVDHRMTPPSERDNPERTSLEVTLHRAARGEERAWRDLVNAYSGRVFGLIKAQCNNADLAEEITQSTFCTIVAKISGYTELGKFEQWLFRIAMNRLRDEMRRRKRQARTFEEGALTGLAESSHAEVGLGTRSSASGRGDSILRVDPEQSAALRSALAELSESDQQIIHLRHFGGLGFKQIAEVLDQPLGTVLARQHRALKKLAELLGGRDSVGGRE